jgi:hypothetical protein
LQLHVTMTVLPLRAAALVALTGLVVACAGAPADEPVGTSEQRAIVTQSQADRAFTIAKGLDYLPWGYTKDGCYARALYMSMELAVEKIPSSAQYIYATDGAHFAPASVSGPAWTWHVAAMIKVTATGTPMIIDPSLFEAPQVARSLDTWIDRIHPVPATDYGLALVQGSHYWQIGDLVDTQPIASFAELDPFQRVDIESACTVAWDELALEEPRPSDQALAARRDKLIVRTRALVTGLRAVDKLSDLTAEDLSCGDMPASGG